MPENPSAKAKVCLPRSKENLIAFIDARQVEVDPQYQPGHGYTWCNKYVRDLLKDLEVPFPNDAWFAHQQIDYLSSFTGEAAGWSECDSGQAAAFANLGQPVVVTYRNPLEPPKGHSHIALVRPSESTLKVRITQAGARNYVDTALEMGFGKLPVRFFWTL